MVRPDAEHLYLSRYGRYEHSITNSTRQKPVERDCPLWRGHALNKPVINFWSTTSGNSLAFRKRGQKAAPIVSHCILPGFPLLFRRIMDIWLIPMQLVISRNHSIRVKCFQFPWASCWLLWRGYAPSSIILMKLGSWHCVKESAAILKFKSFENRRIFP